MVILVFTRFYRNCGFGECTGFMRFMGPMGLKEWEF